MKRTPFIAMMVLLFSLFTGFAHAEPATININTADIETLASLNGIGQSKAEAIVAYRDANGPFQSSYHPTRFPSTQTPHKVAWQLPWPRPIIVAQRDNNNRERRHYG